MAFFNLRQKRKYVCIKKAVKSWSAFERVGPDYFFTEKKDIV